jgi:DNA repair exonuclease SbcCD ATPase subunit
MKIDRIIVDGFGKLRNQQIRFAQDRVNLLVEDNEFGKSTIAEAICAALYGFSRERTTQDKLSGIDAKRPLSGGLYKVTLELSIQGRPFRVTRDFDGDTVLIVDLDSRQDVTGEFFPKKGGPQVGERLIGLSREQFERSCFVGHHSLIHQSASTDLKRNFEQIASSSRESKTAAQAIDALQKGLHPLRGAIMGDSIKADTEVHRLEGELARLKARLSELEDNRRRHDSDVNQLSLLEKAIDSNRKERARLETLQAAAYAQELGARVSEQEQLHLGIEGLRQERDGLASLAAFPAAINDNLASWLAQLKTKAAELSRRGTEIVSTKEEVEKLVSQRSARFSNLAAFTPSDRDELVAVREQLLSIASQAAEVERLRQAELESLRNRGILPGRFDELHSRLKKLEPPVREAAVGYREQHQEIIAKLSRNEGLVKDKSHIVAEIDAERHSKKRNTAYLLAASVFSTVIFGILSFLTDFRLVCGSISAISFAFVLLLLVIRQRAIVIRSDDRAKAKLDVEQSTLAAEESRISLQKLESQWNSVAKSVAMESANELARACLEYLRLGEELSEFRRLTNELNLLEQQKQRVQSEGLPYLRRAGCSVAVSSDITQQDVEKICRELEASFRMGDQIKTFDDRLKGQTVEKQRTTEDIDALTDHLRKSFQEAGIKVQDSGFDKAYELFRERLEKNQRLKRINTEELPRLEKAQIPAEQFAVLKRERESANEKLGELGAMEIVPQQTHGQYTDELSKHYSELERFTEEQAKTRRTILEALGDYDRESNHLLEKVDELDTRLGRVISYRDAVSLALEKLKSIANDVHREWSESLNSICDDMLSTITSVYKSIRFADDLSFTVETGEPAELLTMRDITSRLSLGAREQLFLLQRLAVSRFLSDAAVKLPMILDDPLVTSDDDRFLRLMRFVIEGLPEEHQVLIFSCHKRRHEWLRGELGDLFAKRVHLVQLEPIEAGGGSVASEVISHVNEVI